MKLSKKKKKKGGGATKGATLDFHEIGFLYKKRGMVKTNFLNLYKIMEYENDNNSILFCFIFYLVPTSNFLIKGSNYVTYSNIKKNE